VWAKGLAIVWQRFCVTATSTDGQLWDLATVAPDLGPPASLVVRLPERG